MVSWLKKYFVPHKENSFRPHFFHADTVIFTGIVLGSLFLLLVAGSGYLVRSNYFAAIYPQALISYANETRETVLGGSQLSASPVLERAAKMKAEDMAHKGYFAHTSPSGETPWYWLDQAGYVFKYAGENLAINFVDSKEVQNAWLASPSHRENILNPKFKEIGIATATGTYQEKEAIFVVEFFGTPAEGYVSAKSIGPAPAQKNGVQAISPVHKTEEPIAIEVSGVKEKQVAGTYKANTASFWERLSVSPKTGLVQIYSYFMAIVLSLILFTVGYELRKHHISIWVNGFVLLAMTAVFIIATLYFQFGAPRIV